MIFLTTEAQRTAGMALIGGAALLTLLAFGALALGILRQRRADSFTLPSLGEEEEVEAEVAPEQEESAFRLDDPLTDLGSGEGEDLLREIRREQEKETRSAKKPGKRRGILGKKGEKK